MVSLQVINSKFCNHLTFNNFPGEIFHCLNSSTSIPTQLSTEPIVQDFIPNTADYIQSDNLNQTYNLAYDDNNLHGSNNCHPNHHNQLISGLPYYSCTESGYTTAPYTFQSPQSNVYVNSYSSDMTINGLNAIQTQSPDDRSNNEGYGASTTLHNNVIFSTQPTFEVAQHNFNLDVSTLQDNVLSNVYQNSYSSDVTLNSLNPTQCESLDDIITGATPVSTQLSANSSIYNNVSNFVVVNTNTPSCMESEIQTDEQVLNFVNDTSLLPSNEHNSFNGEKFQHTNNEIGYLQSPFVFQSPQPNVNPDNYFNDVTLYTTSYQGQSQHDFSNHGFNSTSFELNNDAADKSPSNADRKPFKLSTLPAKSSQKKWKKWRSKISDEEWKERKKEYNRKHRAKKAEERKIKGLTKPSQRKRPLLSAEEKRKNKLESDRRAAKKYRDRKKKENKV